MQTKKQCLVKIRKTLPYIKDLLLTESIRLLNSGGIDFETKDDNFVAAKIIITAALKNITDQFEPYHKPELMKEVKNLSHF